MQFISAPGTATYLASFAWEIQTQNHLASFANFT